MTICMHHSKMYGNAFERKFNKCCNIFNSHRERAKGSHVISTVSTYQCDYDDLQASIMMLHNDAQYMFSSWCNFWSLQELLMKLPYNAHEHVYFNMVLSRILYHVRHIPKFTLKVAWRILERKLIAMATTALLLFESTFYDRFWIPQHPIMYFLKFYYNSSNNHDFSTILLKISTRELFSGHTHFRSNLSKYKLRYLGK